MAKKRKIGDVLKEKLDFPIGAGAAESSVEIFGRRRVMVRGCKRIIEYGELFMSLEVVNGHIDVRGRELYCIAYTCGSVEISGEISCVELGEESICR